MFALQKLPLTILHSFNKHSLLVPSVCLATPAPHQFSITSSRQSVLVISLCIEKSWGAKGFCKNMFVLCDFFLRLWECLETKASQNASATCTGMAKRGLCAILGDGICSYCACSVCLPKLPLTIASLSGSFLVISVCPAKASSKWVRDRILKSVYR